MRRLVLAAAGVLALSPGGVAATAGTVSTAPQPKAFEQDGQTYQWSIAHGATGGLGLNRLDRSESEGGRRLDFYSPELTITCSGLRSGALYTQIFEPAPNATQIRLNSGKATLRVRAVPGEVAGRRFVEGAGDLPDGWFDALGRAERVTLSYAGQAHSFPGPGAALTRHFAAYCAELARRAARDE